MGGSWVEEEAGGIYGIKGLATVATQLGEYALQSRLSGGLQKPYDVFVDSSVHLALLGSIFRALGKSSERLM